MEGEGGEFYDWELLHKFDTNSQPNSSEFSLQNSIILEGIESHLKPDDTIMSDYFSVDNRGRHAKAVSECSDGREVLVNNPSSINRDSMKENSGQSESNSGSHLTDERKSNEPESKTKLGLVEIGKIENHIGEINNKSGNLGSLGSGESKLSGVDPKGTVGFAEKFVDLGKQNETFTGDLESGNKSKTDSVGGEKHSGEKESTLAIEELKQKANSGGEEKRGRVLWWKTPFEVLKYCVFRVKPVWSFTVAVALVGVAILGRRLQQMKRKSQSFQGKVTMDDKKISRIMSQAARQNEAFSVVRRVPVVRASLSATGVHPWPVMIQR